MNIPSRLFLLLALLGQFLISGCATAKMDAPLPAVEPGVDTKIPYPGYLGYMQVYLPENYDEDEDWPVIIYYHGYKSRPNTAIFRAVTGGEDFIIVGVNYAKREFYQRLADNQVNHELWHFNQIIESLDRTYSIDKKRLFLSGYSQGGYTTALLGEFLLPQVKGLIILGAGRKNDFAPSDIAGLANKPIFIGAGDKDVPHGVRARQAAKSYLDWQADVTLELWYNMDHLNGFQIYMKNPKARYNIQNWLKKHAELE